MADVGRVQPETVSNGLESRQTSGAYKPTNRRIAQADVVELSTVAKLSEKARELPEIRTDLVEQAKAEIEAGVYETPQRIEIAVQRLLAELFGDT